MSERSPEPITTDDLRRLAELAAADRADRFARKPHWRPYQDRILCTALCQGAALHFVDGKNGVKDFDVFTFYAEDPDVGPYPARWPTRADFGPSKFGRYPHDPARYTGRRVDFFGRSLKTPKHDDPIEAVVAYLSEARSDTARLLAAKAVVGLDPPNLLGEIIWPEQQR